MKYLIFMNMVIISLIVFGLTQLFYYRKNRVSWNMHSHIHQMMIKSKWKQFNYERISLLMKQYGVEYMFHKKAAPAYYIICKMMTALLMGVLATSEQIYALIPIFGVFGFYIPDILLKLSNSNDNDRMLSDIKTIYDTLKIQTKAGVFLTNALTECYLGVKNKRLKTALLELLNKIIAKNDIETAINEFNMLFKNSFIDTLCIVIKQSLESGQSVQVLSDISSQLTDIQHVLALKEKAKLERKIEVLQLFVFVGILAICVFALGIQLMDSLTGF